MNNRRLFVTPLYEADVLDDVPLDALAHAIRSMARDDQAGKIWSREHGYAGYTSYSSVNDLPRRDPDFADLGRLLSKHAARFAKSLAWDVKPKLDSLWVNLLKDGGYHGGHIHPHAILSGTVYVEVPPGSGVLRFEDPRLPMMMAAPVRSNDAPEELRPFVDIEPVAGRLLLWESWLRHGVRAGDHNGERISVSFNFR
jgi:uncharacterized protein (TIGR02466 family)